MLNKLFQILDGKDYVAYRKASSSLHRKYATGFAIVLILIMTSVSVTHLRALIDTQDFSFLFSFKHKTVFLVSIAAYSAMLMLLLCYRGKGSRHLPVALMMLVLLMAFALGQLDARNGSSILAFALGVIFVCSFMSLSLPLTVTLYPAYFYVFYQVAESDGVFAAYKAEYIPLVGLAMTLAVVMEVNRQRRFRDRLTIRRQLLELKGAVQFKARIVSQISHELKTPLNAIIGFSRILEETSDEDLDVRDFREMAGIINQSGHHLLELINNILLLNKKNATKLNVIPSRLSIGVVMEEVLPLIETDRKMRDHRLAYSCSDNVPEVIGDKMMLKQVLLNILSNAIKYTPDGGLIDVAIYTANDEVHLAISDNGQGMTEDEVNHAMEPFNQVESAVLDANMGTGLGLPIIRELTDSMEIGLDIQSSKGEGTRIVLIMQPAGSKEGLQMLPEQEMPDL